MRHVIFCLLLLLMPAVAGAQGVVSSADPRASEAGREILRQGGSATDAAMAMLLALNVVEPQSSGIGGGGFLIHHDAARGLTESIDGRETAPASADPARFLDRDGRPLPFSQAVPGGLSVGVPGNVALMVRAHERWGKLPWNQLFAPAIRLARDGFTVNARLAEALLRAAPLWADFPDARAIYWIDGRPAREGEVIRNPALADVLEQVAAQGPSAFYRGQAGAIGRTVAAAPRNPASLTEEDMARYRAVERPPVCGHYRLYKICSMGPPSSGAVTMLQILGMVERFDLPAWGKDDVRSWHVLAQAMRLAYADRDTWLGDTDFVAAPVAGLIDPAYLARRSRRIMLTATPAAFPAGTPPGAQARTRGEQADIHGTTHFVAVDAAGDIASMTSTIEGPFGSQLVVNGYFLNNELTDFSFAPERDGAPVANRVEAGKRPLSSMSPAIVYDARDRPIFAVGAAGGRTIIMQVAKAIIARLDWGMDPREAIGTGLIFFRGDDLIVEKDSSLVPMAPALAALGHSIVFAEMPLKANAIAREGEEWIGAADPRSPGVALRQ